jgi:stalled ribosome rescue protein Dom34
MISPYHAIIWSDQREAKVFHFNSTGVDRMILHPHRPTRHIHRNANTRVGCGSLLDDEFFERVAVAIAVAKAILITGPDAAKSELAAYLTRHHPETAGCIVGVETIDHPSDGALAAVARLYFNPKDSSQPGGSRTELGF